ncbi:MAG: nuclear transport factor 2 family protein [Bacteroidota bacterium]
MSRYPTLIFYLIVLFSYSQQARITFQVNGKDQLNIKESPFKHFIGEWTLKEDKWTHNWGGTTETVQIPKHHTVSSQINTANSLLSIIDGPEPNGHIFWSYNPIRKEVHHLSSFGEMRSGVGKGHISDSGAMTLKISFEGEPENTYRIYKYTWVNQDEYHMKSVQYDSHDVPTGVFYEGTFVRLPNRDVDLRTQIEAVLSILDNGNISVEEQLGVYADDIVHMAPGSEAHIGKGALGPYLTLQRQNGEVKMKHEILEIETFDDRVLMRGQVTGTFRSKNGTPPVAFRTKNLFVFITQEGTLKIKRVIYNSSPME